MNFQVFLGSQVNPKFGTNCRQEVFQFLRRVVSIKYLFNREKRAVLGATRLGGVAVVGGSEWVLIVSLSGGYASINRPYEIFVMHTSLSLI
jgi:hypothetical protein